MSVLEGLFGKEWVEFLGENELAEVLGDISAKLLVERGKEEANVLPLPGNPNLFKCFKLTPPTKVKLVIPGVEPYHSTEFTGLSFSSDGEVPPVLETLIDEVVRTHGGSVDPSLVKWAEQGVLLFNLANSISKGTAYEHVSIWMPLTKLIIKKLNDRDGIVWLLLGNYVQDIDNLLDNSTHTIIKYGYPSPLNREYSIMGSDCFQQCNEAMLKYNNVIRWTDE